MKLPVSYITTLFEKDVIPKIAWSTKYYDNVLCYVLKNEIYCKVFWMDLWYNYFAEKFKIQNMVNVITNQDLTLPVILTPTLILYNAPTIMQNVYYYSTPKTDNSPFRINISMNTVLLLFLFVFVCIIAATIKFARYSIYTMLI
ncbi:PIF-6 [Callinectes sapidus nudivirus]|nr:PIF-6 [Callinectes sapidus nudivirus]